MIVPTKINYEVLNIKVSPKYYTSYIIHNVIFRPHWLKPFSKYNAKPSLNTKWRQISMECFHFPEQLFQRICQNKAPTVSVQHFLLSILDYRHIKFQRLPHFSIIIPIFHGQSLGCNQSKLSDIPLCVRFLSFWCSIDLLMTFFFVSPLHTNSHEHFNLYTPA